MAAGGSSKAVLAAFFGNSAVAAAKFAAYLFTQSFRTAVEEARPRKGDLSWWQYIRRERMPELPVVLLEDLGAQAGLSIAFVCRPDQLSEPGGFGGAGRN